MTNQFDDRETPPGFCGRLRVATQTALAQDDMRRGRARRPADRRLPGARRQGTRRMALSRPRADERGRAGARQAVARARRRRMSWSCRRRASSACRPTPTARRGSASARSLPADGVFDRDGRAASGARGGGDQRRRSVGLRTRAAGRRAVTARVFVPLVGANGEAAQVFEAIAGEIAPEAHPARLVPQISELFDFGLYGIGQTVREAVDPLRRRAPRQTMARPAQRPRQSLELAHFRSAGRPPLRRERPLGRPRPGARGDVPGVRARSRRRLRHRRNPAAQRRPARRRSRSARSTACAAS